jgi:hypothetical protein
MNKLCLFCFGLSVLISCHQASLLVLLIAEQFQDTVYERGTVRQTESKIGGSRILLLREREKESKTIYSKRQIPGGPDGRHHSCEINTKKKCGYE